MTDLIPKSPGLVGLTRRQWLRCCAGGLVLGMIGSASARAASKLPRVAVSYQDHPYGGKDCSNCAHYIPAKRPAKDGQCEIVAGPVSPQGYCVVWETANPTDGCT